jgi:glycerophosphoryl diester phosphodiesterase
MTDLRVVAHRGDSHHYPENTLASFAAALEAGAEYVELDVQLTRDDELVVIHDPTLDRTTTGAGPVVDHTLNEIRQLSAGYPQRFGSEYSGERIPTFAEALELLRGRARVLVEIKPESVQSDDDAIERRTLDAIEAAGMNGSAGVASFHPLALARCQKLAAQIPRSPLFASGSAEEIVAVAQNLGSDLVLPHKSLLSEALCDRASRAGLRLAVWVVDDVEEFEALHRFDLYGVGTNRPGDLLESQRRSEPHHTSNG